MKNENKPTVKNETKKQLSLPRVSTNLKAGQGKGAAVIGGCDPDSH